MYAQPLYFSSACHINIFVCEPSSRLSTSVFSPYSEETVEQQWLLKRKGEEMVCAVPN